MPVNMQDCNGWRGCSMWIFLITIYMIHQTAFSLSEMPHVSWILTSARIPSVILQSSWTRYYLAHFMKAAMFEQLRFCLLSDRVTFLRCFQKIVFWIDLSDVAACWCAGNHCEQRHSLPQWTRCERGNKALLKTTDQTRIEATQHRIWNKKCGASWWR